MNAKAIITIIRELYNADDTESLRRRFKEIKEIGPIKLSLDELEDKLKRYYSTSLILCSF